MSIAKKLQQLSCAIWLQLLSIEHRIKMSIFLTRKLMKLSKLGRIKLMFLKIHGLMYYIKFQGLAKISALRLLRNFPLIRVSLLTMKGPSFWRILKLARTDLDLLSPKESIKYSLEPNIKNQWSSEQELFDLNPFVIRKQFTFRLSLSYKTSKNRIS